MPAAGPRPARTRRGAPTLLTRTAPVVTLAAMQSGIGRLHLEAACSPAVGDLRLAGAYRLTSGASSVVLAADGLNHAPPRSTRPLITAQHGRYEELVLDLVKVRDLDRLVVLAFSDSGASLNWGGTLLVTTFGGAQVKIALDREAAPGVLVALSVYRVNGELVLRSEAELVAGTVRDACLAYGFEDVAWLDPRTPIV